MLILSQLMILVAFAIASGRPAESLALHMAAGAQEGDPANGRRIFVATGCYQCHGREAQGSSAGPRLGPSPLPLAGFTRYVRRPRGEMPPYTAKVLTDAQLADIHAFLRGLPRPPAVSTLPWDPR